MTKEELKNQIIELKETCKKLAEEYREKYNQDNENKIALNMLYHNVISYNDYESVLALIENRNSVIMCFSAPPVLTEETVEINLKRIADLEKDIELLKNGENLKELQAEVFRLITENAELKEGLRDANEKVVHLACNQNKDLKRKINKAKDIMKIAIEGVKHWGFVVGTERPFVKQAEMYFNLFLDKAEQFIKDSEV